MGNFCDVMAVDWHTDVLEQNTVSIFRAFADGGTALHRNICN